MHVGERAANAIQLLNDKNVAVAKHVQGAGETGTVGNSAGARILVNPLGCDASGEQRIALEGEALLGRGHPHVADQHRRALPAVAQTVTGQGLLAKERCTG